MSVPNRGVQLASLAADPVGELAAAGALDAFEAYVWSVKTGLLLTVLTGHTAPVSSLEFNPGLEFYGGLELVTASWDGTVRTWSLADCEAAIDSKDVAGGTMTEVFTVPTDVVPAMGSLGPEIWNSREGEGGQRRSDYTPTPPPCFTVPLFAITKWLEGDFIYPASGIDHETASCTHTGEDILTTVLFLLPLHPAPPMHTTSTLLTQVTISAVAFLFAVAASLTLERAHPSLLALNEAPFGFDFLLTESGPTTPVVAGTRKVILPLLSSKCDVFLRLAQVPHRFGLQIFLFIPICTTYRHDGHELAVALLNATILFFDPTDGRQLGSIEGRHDLDVAQVGEDDLVTPYRAAKERYVLPSMMNDTA
ncbi:unnamed protein product [Dibothriocephalus latus]|uniref:Uncharacterized protein n=1 Tax=Dibothriocephalus latus TaxID=60516 RepID=A0A3P6TMF4_DIBLA|nr:unnamed protein product [Dibothriocephalus latus]